MSKTTFNLVRSCFLSLSSLQLHLQLCSI